MSTDESDILGKLLNRTVSTKTPVRYHQENEYLGT